MNVGRTLLSAQVSNATKVNFDSRIDLGSGKSQRQRTEPALSEAEGYPVVQGFRWYLIRVSLRGVVRAPLPAEPVPGKAAPFG
jgi:hypothetical protein